MKEGIKKNNVEDEKIKEEIKKKKDKDERVSLFYKEKLGIDREKRVKLLLIFFIIEK